MMDDSVIDVAKQTVICALKTCRVDHNNAFEKRNLRSDLNFVLISFMEDFSGITGSFEEAIVQVASASKTLTTIASVIAKGGA